MSKVFDWSTTAGSNNDAPPDGWPEQMLPGKVNDCAREMMAALKCWYSDQRGELVTSGTTTAYTLTTSTAPTSLSELPLLVLRVHAGNTGAATLNVDGLGAKSLVKDGGTALSSGDLTTNQNVCVSYSATLDRFDLVGPSPPVATVTEIASGTPMLFGQTSAPTGWTKLLTNNNKALRLVTGTASTGGSTAFTSVFTSRTIAQANLPVVNLSSASLIATVTDPGHTHTEEGVSGSHNTSVSGGQSTVDDNATNNTGSSTTGITVAITGSVPLGGSGTAMDFAVQYVDVIMATKN